MEGNFINANIVLPGEDGKVRKFYVPPTFQDLSDWIRAQGLDEYTTEGLIQLASRTPTSALASFRKNFNIMVARVRQQRKKEQS